MITFSEVEVAYGDHQVLAGMSFQARDGAVTGFVGPNGAGKSTAFKALLGLISPGGGEALVDDRLYRQAPDPGTTIGAFLGPQWLPGSLTGRGYLTYVADLLRVPLSRVQEQLAEVGLADSADRRVRTYSLGMRQRLGIAGAFLGRPRNLILDEPVNGLDVDGVRWLRDYLRSAADSGRCILLSSHILSELEMVADDIVILGSGRVTRSGSIDELRATPDGAVIVTASDVGGMARHLKESGAAVTIDNDSIRVEGRTVNWVATVAGGSGIPLLSVSRSASRLEDVYLDQVAEDRLTAPRIPQPAQPQEFRQ